MRAIILAAGLGTRLGTLSDERPKPMLPVCDIPLIRYAVALLRGHGVDEIAINLHHRGELIERELGPDFHYSREEKILGTGGGLKKIGDWLTRGGRESFFVVNGKILADIDLDEVRRLHEARDATATMVVRAAADATKWGAIDVDGDRVVGMLGAGRHMFTGVHAIAPRLIARLPDGESDSIRQGYLPALRAGEPIAAYVYNGYFQEHSTPERYLEGNWNALAGRARLRYPPGPLSGVDASAQVDGALVEPVRIAAGAVVEAGSTVGPNVVVGARARVRPGARLERVVMWPESNADGTHADAIITPRGVHHVGGTDG